MFKSRNPLINPSSGAFKNTIELQPAKYMLLPMYVKLEKSTDRSPLYHMLMYPVTTARLGRYIEVRA